MKKTILLICALAALAALLAACQPSQQSGSTGAATESTGVPETTVQTETTVPTTAAPPETTVPTTAPVETTEPTEDLLAAYEAWQEYMQSPFGRQYSVFSYDGGALDGYAKPIDTSGMVAGRLYAVNFETAEVKQITDEACSLSVDTSEHIYYVLDAEPSKVYRTDHNGENCTLIYESIYGEVTYIQYYGADSNGKLILCENRNRIVAFDIPTGQIEVLMEAHVIGQFFYSPTSLSFEKVTEHISNAEMGATIFWKGKLHEEDAEEDAIYYFVETGEHWSVWSWEPRM